MSEADTPGGSGEAALAPVTGEIIAGRYRVLGTLGSGGFATVYRAQHLEIRTLEVALKLLHRPPGEVELARFRREAELAASLRHPNIVPVIDFGVLEGGQPFLVMELAEGRSLDEVIFQSGGLSEPEAVSLLEGLLDALTLAHDRGIVHRDIKPANIIVEEAEGDLRFRLLDFGIAKPLNDDENPLTVGDKTFCTPSYASPELLRGKPTLATDLYALALTVAEALEGEAVVRGEGIFEMAKIHLSREPLTFGLRVRVSVLADILQQAVAKGLKERFPNARAMRQAWRAHVAAGLPRRPVGEGVGSAAGGPGARLEDAAYGAGAEDRGGAGSGSRNVAGASVDPDSTEVLPRSGSETPLRRGPDRPKPIVDPGLPTDSRPVSLLLSGPTERTADRPARPAAAHADSAHGSREDRAGEDGVSEGFPAQSAAWVFDDLPLAERAEAARSDEGCDAPKAGGMAEEGSAPEREGPKRDRDGAGRRAVEAAKGDGGGAGGTARLAERMERGERGGHTASDTQHETREADAGRDAHKPGASEPTARTELPARWRRAVPLAALLAVALFVIVALRAGLEDAGDAASAGASAPGDTLADAGNSHTGEAAAQGAGDAAGRPAGEGVAGGDPAARAEARARSVEAATERLAVAQARAAGGELDLRCEDSRCGLRAYWVPLGEVQVQEVALGALPLQGAGLPALRPLTVQYVGPDGSAFLRTYRQAGAIEDHRVAAPEGTRAPTPTPRQAPRVQQAPDALGTVPRVQ